MDDKGCCGVGSSIPPFCCDEETDWRGEFRGRRVSAICAGLEHLSNVVRSHLPPYSSSQDRIELGYVEGTLSEVSRLNLLLAVHLLKPGLQTNFVKDSSNTTRSDSTGIKRLTGREVTDAAKFGRGNCGSKFGARAA